jgi:hypothetical protein
MIKKTGMWIDDGLPDPRAFKNIIVLLCVSLALIAATIVLSAYAAYLIWG